MVPFFDLSKQNKKLEKEYVNAFKAVLVSSEFILGSETKKFEEAFASYIGTKYAVGVNSGLDALSLSLRALGVGPGDEVIVPANSFIATALAVSAVGATPVFVDCDTDYLLMDLEGLRRAISPKTKAVMPVHLYGQPVDMEALGKICAELGIPIIEDACQAHGSKIGDRRAGSFGEAGCFSFYPGKNLGAFGDGGIVTTNNPDLCEKLRLYRNYGSIVKYDHRVPGLNTRLDNLQAAILNVKLPHLDEWNQKRRALAERYRKRLSRIKGLDIPKSREGAYHVFHLYVVRTDRREELKKFLAERGIGTSIHYPQPIHQLAAYRDLNKVLMACPVAEREAPRLLSLPLYPEMPLKSVDLVCAAVREFFA